MSENRGFLYSFIAHLTIVLLMVIQVVFYPSDALDLSQAIRVDMIDLPDKITSQPLPEDTVAPTQKESPSKELPEKEEKPKEKDPIKEPPPKTLPEKKAKPLEDTININKVKSKQKEALSKLKAASAIENLKKEMEETKTSEKQTAQPKTVFKGRVLSAGTAITGLDKLQSDSYLSQVDGRIKAHWTLPQWLIDKPLRARVHIKIDETGNIIYKRISQPSGNQTYDEYCLLAVEKSNPLPRVPEKFTSIYKIDGVVIGFPD